MGFGLREREEGSPPWWRQGDTVGYGLALERLRALPLVQGGDMVLEEQCWSMEGKQGGE